MATTGALVGGPIQTGALIPAPLRALRVEQDRMARLVRSPAMHAFAEALYSHQQLSSVSSANLEVTAGEWANGGLVAQPLTREQARLVFAWWIYTVVVLIGLELFFVYPETVGAVSVMLGLGILPAAQQAKIIAEKAFDCLYPPG